MNTYVIRPTQFRLVAGDPIPTAGLHSRDMEALSARVRGAMCDLYYAHSSFPRPEPTPEPQPEKTPL
jgi:1-acyl-sn-glycerol-3-phosphate acyltransferase